MTTVQDLLKLSKPSFGSRLQQAGTTLASRLRGEKPQPEDTTIRDLLIKQQLTNMAAEQKRAEKLEDAASKFETDKALALFKESIKPPKATPAPSKTKFAGMASPGVKTTAQVDGQFVPVKPFTIGEIEEPLEDLDPDELRDVISSFRESGDRSGRNVRLFEAKQELENQRADIAKQVVVDFNEAKNDAKDKRTDDEILKELSELSYALGFNIGELVKINRTPGRNAIGLETK